MIKIPKIFSIVAVSIFLTTATAFAASDTKESSTHSQNSIVLGSDKKEKGDWKQRHEEFIKDPITALENKKTKVQNLFNEGKITKEEKDRIVGWIDTRLLEIQAFDKLTLQQKKEKLINDCKSKLDKKVSEGKFDKTKADAILTKFTEKINKWDGVGYPQFHSKHHKAK